MYPIEYEGEPISRIDAQHGFLPPAQDAVWLETILRRNRFEGSVLLAADLDADLALAAAHPYIRAVIAGTPVEHPLVRSVRWERPEAAVIRAVDPALAVEVPVAALGAVWEIRDRRVALDGLPERPEELPANFYIKLTGFRLPPDPARAARLRAALRAPGPDRLLFASGWPWEGVSWKERLAAFTQSLGPMPMAVRERLLGETAAEFYRLD